MQKTLHVAATFVQWVLLAVGSFQVVHSGHLYTTYSRLADAGAVGSGDTYYILPIWHHVLNSFTQGVLALGLGLGLWRLRTIYLRKGLA